MLKFDIENVTVTEFGVGSATHERNDEYEFVLVPVDESVQDALHGMVDSTWQQMQQHADGPRQYEPSEKYSAREYLHIGVDSPMITSMTDLHRAENLPLGHEVLSGVDGASSVRCYFARLKDTQGRRLTAVRRAVQFKGVLKTQLVRFLDDTLRMVDDNIFKLDIDFDLMIDSERLHIWRPSAFEFLAHLTPAVLAAVPTNVTVVRKKIPFVDFEYIQRYASEHPRAARYLASICTQKLVGIDPGRLQRACQITDVELKKDDHGRLVVSEGHVIGFLEVLDRRRYAVDLVAENCESFVAASRRKL